jgi:hypothetical protein
MLLFEEQELYTLVINSAAGAAIFSFDLKTKAVNNKHQ